MADGSDRPIRLLTVDTEEFLRRQSRGDSVATVGDVVAGDSVHGRWSVIPRSFETKATGLPVPAAAERGDP